jgi:hypothetical protein
MEKKKVHDEHEVTRTKDFFVPPGVISWHPTRAARVRTPRGSFLVFQQLRGLRWK